MDKLSYLKELEFLLSDISLEDRNEALEYYYSYFEDAGEENEQEVIKQLGDPSRIAAMIKAELNGQFEERIEVSNQGFVNEDYERHYEIVEGKEVKESFIQRLKNMQRRDKGILVLIVLAIFIPLILPVFGICMGFFAGLVSLAIAVALMVFGIWIVALILFIIAIICIVFGVLQLFITPATGFIFVGVGIILLAFSKVGLRVGKWVFKVAIPYVVDRLSDMFNRFIDKRGNQDEAIN